MNSVIFIDEIWEIHFSDFYFGLAPNFRPILEFICSTFPFKVQKQTPEIFNSFSLFEGKDAVDFQIIGSGLTSSDAPFQ